MKNNTKFIYFDIGGVFIGYDDVFKSASKTLRLEREKIDQAFDKFNTDITTGNITPEDLINYCYKDCRVIPPKDFNFTDSWISDYTKFKKTYDLVFDIQDNFDIGLLSNIYKEFIPKMIERGFLPDINYKTQVISCDIGMQKPDKDIYLYAEKKSGFSGDTILYIDDRQDFIDPAASRGWNTFLFDKNDPVQAIKDLRDYIDFS